MREARPSLCWFPFDKGEGQDYNLLMDGRISSPLTIRGHTLLCLQGFRGEGYSPAFITNMSAIHDHLSLFPNTGVRVVQRPDQICNACPHLRSDGCHLRGPGFEKAMNAQDRDVMIRLGIENGEVLPWREVLKRISMNIMGCDLDDLCGGCPWLPLGYCQEGIDRLGSL